MMSWRKSALVGILLGCALPVLAQEAFSPVAEWRMDEPQWTGAGGEVVDSSGNGLNGRARTAGNDNSLPTTTTGQVCRGGEFRGQGFNDPKQNNAYIQAQQYVEVDDAQELSPLATSGSVNFSGWFQAENANSKNVILHKGEGGASQEYQVAIDNRRLQITLWDPYGSPRTLSLSGVTIQDDTWYFFDAVAARQSFDRLGARVSLLDENGNVLDSQTGFTNDDFFSPPGRDYDEKPLNGELTLGAERFSSTNVQNFFNGTLDEIRIHNTILGGNELRALAGITRECEEEEPLQCFNDGFGGGLLLPEDWVTTRSSGNFSPQIVGGRLRMTEAAGNQATAATYQKLFPGADNLVQIEFDYYAYGGSGADGVAIVLSDASVTPQAGGYGGSLGYAQEPDGSGGFEGGWLGIGLDEFGNFSNDSEGRVGGNNGRTLDSVAVRGAEPDYTYIADSGGLSPGIDASNDDNPYRYRITLDSRSSGSPILSVERNGRGNGSDFELLIQETLTGQPPIPENLFLSMTGSTGGSTNIHELDNLQICAERVGAVEAQVDHFELEHSGSGLTCRPEEVTIRACDNADCSQTFDDPVEVTLAPTGWVGGDTFTMTGGTATRQLSVTSAGTVTLKVPGSEPSTRAFAQTLCNDGSGGLSASNCDLTFADSGFDISVQDHVSDTSQTAEIAAVSKDDSSERCVPGFSNESKDVALWSGYVNPASGTENLFVDGDALPISQTGTTTLAFDGNGVASIPMRYPDVGRVQLNARYEGEAGEEDAGLVMTGNGDFVARPDQFQLVIPGNPAAEGVADGNVFIAAGSDFEINVAALNASGNITPNFGQESPRESVSLANTLIGPAGGRNPPLAGAFGPFGENCASNASQGGTACGQFQWPEVGIIAIDPSLTSGRYLGTEDVTGARVDHVGRFVPANFDVSVEAGNVHPFPVPDWSCSASTSFAYIGRAMKWEPGSEPELTVSALNAQGNLTENYTMTPYRRLFTGDFGRNPSNTDQVARNSDSALFPVTTDLNPGTLSYGEPDPGKMLYRFSSADTVTYDKTAQSRVQPFDPRYRIQLISLEDADGVTSSDLPVDIDPEFDFKMRYGRWAMDNVFGPENAGALAMPFRVEYWSDDGRFELNIEDSCTAWNTTDVIGPETYHTLQADSGTFSGGDGGPLLLDPKLSALPANKPTDRLTWAVPSWLKGYWDDDNTLDDPSGLATFGVYRGHDRVIYWREK